MYYILTSTTLEANMSQHTKHDQSGAKHNLRGERIRTHQKKGSRTRYSGTPCLSSGGRI